MDEYIYAAAVGLVTLVLIVVALALFEISPLAFSLVFGSITVGPLGLYLYRRFWK